MKSDNYIQRGRTLRIVVGILMLVLLLGNNTSAAKIITVPDNHTKIQWAIDNATAGDTIEVHSGIYYENVNVNKQLILRGIGMPVVDAGISGSAITLSANGIILEGFTATGGGSYPKAGIKVFSNNNKLSGNNVSNNGYGIILSSSGKNNTLNGNNASSNDYGIFLSSSSNNTLSGNNVKSNTYYGIFLGSSGNNTLRGNNASNNYCGIDMSSSNNNNIYHNNLLENTYQALDNTNTNSWNTRYPSGGNYWGDYTGFDLKSGSNQDIPGSDGIGDTPYNISDGAQDRYPFMNESGWVGIKYPLSKIVISGLPTTTLPVGGSHLFTATALDQSDNPVEGINVSWTVTNSSVGNIDSPNVISNVTGGATSTFTALVAGTTMVHASNGSVTGTANVTVGNVLPSLFISFIDPTPANGVTLTQNYAFINTTGSDSSTAFIDWNSSLIGWWRFNGENGENSTFFRDWSSWGNNAACSGISCPTPAPGKFGNALNFDGSNDYADVPNSAILNPSNITIETWFNANSGGLADQKSLIQKPYTSNATPYYQYMLSLADTVGSPRAAEFYLAVDGVMRFVEIKNLSYDYGQWHYLAGTYNGSTITMYLDGNIVGTTQIVGTITSYNTILEFGAYPNLDKSSSHVFKGKLDEARIHSRALSPEEIKASYNAGTYRLYNNFTNLATGAYNYMAYDQDLAGNVNQTETRSLTVVSSISFIDPTPANNAILSQNYAFINTTVSNISTAFIDWNRSLAGWWRFNGESCENSTFSRDWSSWGNNATCSGINCPLSTPGKFGNALNFDGSNDYVTVPNSAILNPSYITLEMWFNANSGGLAGQKPLIQKPYTSRAAPYYQYMLSLADTAGSPKAAEFYLTINGVMRSIEVKNLSYIYGQWHYLAGTYNGSTMTMYLDGNIVGTTPIVGTITSYNTILEFGAYPNVAPSSSNVFKGKLDEARIHIRALSPDEIKASYNAGIYRLYNNFSNLATGAYNYRGYDQNLAGNVNQTETRSLTIVSIQGAPAITSFAPASPVNDIAGAIRPFSIGINQTVNVNWSINGKPVQSNASVTGAIYTNTSSLPGTWIVNATATNANGTDSREWTWIVTLPSPLVVSISESPDPVISNGTSQVTVHVTSGNSNVVGANVGMSITGGSLSSSTGATDVNGNFMVTYTAPSVTASTTYTISTTASKTGFASGSGSDLITVNPGSSGLRITNIVAASGKKYVNDTLAIGKLFYFDRTYKFTNIPPSYTGLNYIKTATDDRYRTESNFLQFDVNKDVTVYVAYDDRISPKPTWLTSVFTDTGDNVVRDDSSTFSIYSRNYPAGHISLGGSAILSGGVGGSYVVIVKPQGSPLPSTLIVSISESPDPVMSGGTSQVTVHVTSGGSNVAGANVGLSITGGSLGSSTGATDASGNFMVTYTAPKVTASTTHTISATASKTGFVSGSGSDLITVNPGSSGLRITNIVAASGKKYVNDTLAIGKLFYFDRTYKFTNIPPSYTGLNYIKTATDDRYRTESNFLQFDVNKDVTVYVAYDDRISPKPTWLTSVFTDTGDNVVRDDSSTFSIYSRNYPAGHISLGGTAIPSGGAGGSYVVIVK